jgi:hypothetical protein
LSVIDIIRAANRKEALRVALELPGGVRCWLHLPNRHQIADVQEKLYRIAYAEAAELGLVGKPINEAEWDRQLSKLNKKEKERAEKEKPVDMAEQYARGQSVAQAVYNLLPGMIHDDDGVELFGDISDKRAFLREVQGDQKLDAYLMGKWNELFAERGKVEEEAKNS